MAARPVDDGFQAARSQRFGRDMIRGRTIEDDGGAQARLVGFDHGAHAAQIAFALFADVGNKKNGALRLDASFVDGACERNQSDQPGAVIGNSWGGHAAVFVADLHVGARRKYGVEMRREENNFFIVGPANFSDDVAGLVALNLQADGGKERLDGSRALRFVERRRGNFSEARLLIVDPGEVSRKPIQCRADLRIVGQLCARIRRPGVGRDGRANRHDEKDNPKKDRFHRLGFE